MNDVVWNNTQFSPTQIGLQSFNTWQAWYAANYSQIHEHQAAQNNNNTCWRRPNEGWLKINVDAAFFHNQRKTSVACCVRRDDGSFLCAQTRNMSLVPTVLEGEALALLEASRLAVQQGWDRVVFESDSNTLVHAIINNNVGNSEFSTIVSSIKNNLSLLTNFEVKFVRRQANSVAHSLARASVSWASHRFFNVIPRCIASLVINEMC
jgi:ribonuclease HI